MPFVRPRSAVRLSLTQKFDVKLRHPWMVKSLAWLTAKVLRGIARTCTFEVFTEAPATNPADPQCKQRYIYAVWHDALMSPVLIRTFRHILVPENRVSALVSQHQDGTLLTEFMQNFNIDAVRGSSSKGGVQALRQMLKVTKTDHICITPDGPRGPRHEVKQGAIYLASVTGCPILASSSAMSRFWNFKGSWTNILIPKPFSRIVNVVSRPIVVPRNLTPEQLTEYQDFVTSELNRVDALAHQFIAGELTELPAPSATEPLRAAA